MMTRTKGFTLVELVVVIVCLAILVTLSACMRQGPEPNYRASCLVNLRGIGMAIAMYRGEDKNSRFPLLFTTGQPESNIAPTDAAGSITGLKTKLAGREAAMQNVWLLIDKGLIIEDSFACPADKDFVPRKFADKTDRRAHKVGWRSSANFSFGMHFPYKSTTVDGKTVDNPAYLDAKLDGSFVIMADKNPSRTNEPATGVGGDKAPSNHGDYGQAYLMYSGQVNWKAGAEDSRINDDDIYTIQTQNNANGATPTDLDDQYITRHPIDE